MILVTCHHPPFFSQMGSKIHLLSHPRKIFASCLNCFFLGEKAIAVASRYLREKIQVRPGFHSPASWRTLFCKMRMQETPLGLGYPTLASCAYISIMMLLADWLYDFSNLPPPPIFLSNGKQNSFAFTPKKNLCELLELFFLGWESNCCCFLLFERKNRGELCESVCAIETKWSEWGSYAAVSQVDFEKLCRSDQSVLIF